MANEVWRDIPGYEGWYQASSEGRVRSVRRPTIRGGVLVPRKGKVLRPEITRTGYHRYALGKDGVRKRFLAHRLVMLAFVGESPGMDVLHWDDVKSNNVLTNLRYGNDSDNAMDRVRLGTHNWLSGNRRIKETK